MPSKRAKLHSMFAKSRPDDAIDPHYAAVTIQNAFRRYCVQRDSRSKKLMYKKRSNIATELLTTERTYVTNLDLLIHNFLLPLESVSSKILRGDLQTNLHLIGSIVKVIYSYHGIILNKIEERLNNWNPNTKLGDIFLEMSSYLKAYTQYVTHYQPVLRLLRSRKNDSALQQTLNGLITPDCHGKGLKDFLIMPIQRLPRYNMMLEDLLRKTAPTHCDYVNLEAASQKISAVCEHVEVTSDHASRLEKKMELAAKIVFPKGDPVTLALPHRQFLWEADAGVTTNYPTQKNTFLMKRPVRLFVFSDLFVFCDAATKNDLYKVILSVPLETIETFRAVRSAGSLTVNAFLFHLGIGECKIENLAPHYGKILEEFFVSLANGSNDEIISPRKRVQKTSTNSPQVDRTRRTVQVQRQCSVMLPNYSGAAGRERAETVNHSSSTIVSSAPSPSSSKSRFTRAISSKTLRRTLSTGRFGKEKISKSSSKDEGLAATKPDNPPEEERSSGGLTKSKTSDRLKDLSGMIKSRKGPRSSDSTPTLRKHQKATL